MQPRPYQREAIDNIIRSLGCVDSTLAVMPTGTGKTVVFAHVIGGASLALGFVSRVAAGANAVILAGAVVVHLAGTASTSMLGGNVSFQFTFFVFFALLLLVWRGSGPLSLDHLLRIDVEEEPDLFHEA